MTKSATKVEEVTSERDTATVARDAALTAEAYVRVQADARGQELSDMVAYLRGAVTTLDNAEVLLETAVERENTT